MQSTRLRPSRPYDEVETSRSVGLTRGFVANVLEAADPPSGGGGKSLGMGYANHEIFQPQWYAAWASSLQDNRSAATKGGVVAAAAEDHSLPPPPPPLARPLEECCRPLPDQYLLSLESSDLQRIIRGTHQGIYKDFRFDIKRADGLPSITHVFHRAEKIKYHYRPNAGQLGTGQFSSNVNPQILGLPDLNHRMALWAKTQTDQIISQYHLQPKLIETYGVFFNVTLRFDYTCVQLTKPDTMIRQTRRLASVFGSDARAFLVDQRAIRGLSYLRQGAGRAEIVSQYTTLEKELDLAFLGFQADDLIPFQGEPLTSFQKDGDNIIQPLAQQVAATQPLGPLPPAVPPPALNQKFGMLVTALDNFNRFCESARKAMSFFLQINPLYRPRQAAKETAEAMRRQLMPNGLGGVSLATALAYPKDQLDFQFTQRGGLDAPCSEVNLFAAASQVVGAATIDSLIIADLCINLPHAELYPLEKFWVQCRGWYPAQTLAHIIHNSAHGVRTSQPNKFGLYQCTNAGWQNVRHYFDQPDPAQFMAFCRSKQIGAFRPPPAADAAAAAALISPRVIHEVYGSPAEKANILNY